MEKKILKWYEAPQVEIVEMETAVSLLAGSKGTTSGGITTPDTGDDQELN